MKLITITCHQVSPRDIDDIFKVMGLEVKVRQRRRYKSWKAPGSLKGCEPTLQIFPVVRPRTDYALKVMDSKVKVTAEAYRSTVDGRRFV